MRLLSFTLLAIAIAVGVQLGLVHLPRTISDVIHKFDTALLFLSPVIITAGLAYAMRISSVGYVIMLAILSPVVSWILSILIGIYVLNENPYFWPG